MSINVNDKKGTPREIMELSDRAVISYAFVENVDFQGSDLLEGIKQVWSRIPTETERIILLRITCAGSKFHAIVQKNSENYGCVILYGYAIDGIRLLRVTAGNWHNKLIG